MGLRDLRRSLGKECPTVWNAFLTLSCDLHVMCQLTYFSWRSISVTNYTGQKPLHSTLWDLRRSNDLNHHCLLSGLLPKNKQIKPVLTSPLLLKKLLNSWHSHIHSWLWSILHIAVMCTFNDIILTSSLPWLKTLGSYSPQDKIINY